MELKDSEELRQLEAAWRSLADLTASWEREMRQTEQLATRLDDQLTDVETRLKQLELNSVEWDLPPSLGGFFCATWIVINVVAPNRHCSDPDLGSHVHSVPAPEPIRIRSNFFLIF